MTGYEAKAIGIGYVFFVCIVNNRSLRYSGLIMTHG